MTAAPWPAVVHTPARGSRSEISGHPTVPRVFGVVQCSPMALCDLFVTCGASGISGTALEALSENSHCKKLYINNAAALCGDQLHEQLVEAIGTSDLQVVRNGLLDPWSSGGEPDC